jgi:hypothetical protein
MLRLIDILVFVLLRSPVFQVKISCFRACESWKKVSVSVVLRYIRKAVYSSVLGMKHFCNYDGVEETAKVVHTCTTSPPNSPTFLCSRIRHFRQDALDGDNVVANVTNMCRCTRDIDVNEQLYRALRMS